MNYIEFKDFLLELVSEKLGPDYIYEIREVSKNNAKRLDGLVIRREDCNISPTIYLESFYDDYEKGRSCASIVEEIIAIYKENALEESIDVEGLMDFDNAKDRIIYKLVNYQKNEILLWRHPHIRVLDLAIVFSYMIDCDQSGGASILINHEHAKLWNLKASDLLRLAQENTPKLLGYTLRDLFEYVSSVQPDYLPGDINPELLDGSDCEPIYILTNKPGLYGAGAILYKDILPKLAEHFNSSFYILPCSIHELILVPESPQTDEEMLSQMVKEVNKSAVRDEDLLSDSVYFYDQMTDKVRLVAS